MEQFLPSSSKPDILTADELKFNIGAELDICRHTRQRDAEGLTMRERNALERRDTPGVSLRRKRKRSELSDAEQLDIIDHYIHRKRPRRSVADRFNIKEQLVTDLARKY